MAETWVLKVHSSFVRCFELSCTLSKMFWVRKNTTHEWCACKSVSADILFKWFWFRTFTPLITVCCTWMNVSVSVRWLGSSDKQAENRLANRKRLGGSIMATGIGIYTVKQTVADDCSRSPCVVLQSTVFFPIFIQAYISNKHLCIFSKCLLTAFIS